MAELLKSTSKILTTEYLLQKYFATTKFIMCKKSKRLLGYFCKFIYAGEIIRIL